MSGEKPTPSMLEAIEKMVGSGGRKLVRVLGGWTTAEVSARFNPQRPGDRPEWFVSTNTVDGMRRRGLVEQAHEQDGLYQRERAVLTKLGIELFMRFRRKVQDEVRCLTCGSADVEHVDGTNPVEFCRNCRATWSA